MSSCEGVVAGHQCRCRPGYDKGIHNLAPGDPDRPRYVAARDALAARFDGRVLSLSDAIVRSWRRLSGEVKRASGHAPPVIGTMLAATAIAHDLYLATRNARDVSLSGAAVFDPWHDDVAMFPLSPSTGRMR